MCMKMLKRRKWFVRLLCAGIMLLGCGCSVEKTDGNKVKELEFTIAEEENVPKELIEEIEVRKEHEFKLSYEDGSKLYIVRGYGKKATGGYSIAVNDVYLSKNAVCFLSTLIGPAENEHVAQTETYPYIIIRLEKQGKNVVFD